MVEFQVGNEYTLIPYVLVAQWIERSPPKRQVAGSTPAEDEVREGSNCLDPVRS